MAARRHPLAPLSGVLSRESTLAGAASALMSGFALSAGLGALRQVMFNSEFGAGHEASAFYAAVVLPGAIAGITGRSVVSAAMIPVLARAELEDGGAAAWRLTNLVLSVLTVVIAAIVLVGELLAPAAVAGLLAPGFDGETRDLTVTLTRLMLLQPLFLVTSGVATAVLTHRNQFLLASLSLAASNAAIIVGVLAAHQVPQLGIYGPTLGVVGGAVLNSLILLPGLRAAGFRFRPTWDLGDRRLREVARLFVPNSVVTTISYSSEIVETSFASRASEAAAIPALHNAWMGSAFAMAVVGQAIGNAVLPRLAAQAAAGDWRQMQRTVLKGLAAGAGLSLPVMCGAFLFGRPAVHLLFEHGRFDSDAADLTYAVLATYLLGLPAYAAIEVLMRAMMALWDVRTLVIAKAGHLCIQTALIALLLERQGVVALPEAAIVGATAEALALGVVLSIKLRARMSPRQPATGRP